MPQGLSIGLLVMFLMGGLWLLAFSPAYAAATLTVTPITWNVIGLDSNSPTSGPYRFPIGARVCSSVATTNVVVNWVWDSSNANINLRPGSLSSITIASITAGGCSDAYFEGEVTQVAGAYDTTRRYHITATDSSGTASTPTPRELYVEHLISQNRNGITDVKLNGTSIPAGGTMTLMVGNTYTVELDGFTATQGYNQLESFINFPNTIFQTLAVSTTYTADSNTTNVPNPNDKLYANACTWDSDPGSPNYRSCIGGDFKAGGTVVMTYTVKIISGAGSSQTLNTLLYDFSGSSFHYNADFTAGARVASIIAPSTVTIQKTFTPKAISPGGTVSMTLKLTNPTTEILTGVNFTDTLQGGLVVSTTTGLSYSGCGSSPSPSTLSGGATALSFSGITLSANSVCTINVNVTAASAGTYPNTTGHLFIDTSIDTGNTGTDTLTASSAPACIPNQTLATWTFPSGSSATAPLFSTKASNVVTATASTTTSSPTIDTSKGNPLPSWSGQGFAKNGTITGDSSPYFQFLIDTSKYSSVKIALDYSQDAAWGGGGAVVTPEVYVWSSTTGAALSFSQVYTSTLFDTTFHSTGAQNAAATGSNLTYFRINAVGAQNTNSNMQVDNVTITGCGIPAPAPTVSKSFSPDPISKGLTSTLTITLTNTASGNEALTGVSITDTLPTGLDIATNSTSQCGGALATTTGTRTIALTGGTLSAGGGCTFTVPVTGTTEGQYNNVTGFISSSESGTSTNYATASLRVIAPPTLEKSFSPASIYTLASALPPYTSTLTFAINNPNMSDSLSGIVFTDTLPVSITVASSGPTSTCSGSLSTASPYTITFTGGSLAANNNCTFSVPVTGSLAGTMTNTTTAISSIEGGNGNAASASIDVQAPTLIIGLNKQISTDNTNWLKYVGIIPTQTVYYSFTVSNDGEVSLNNITVTDPNFNLTSCSWPNPLGVGASASCGITRTIFTVPIPNPFVNTATVTNTTYTPTTAITSTAKYGTESLALSKSVTETSFTTAGDVLHYSYTVTNTGGYPLLGPVVITDTKATVTCPAVTTVGNLSDYLDPSETITCTAAYTVTAGDITAHLVINSAYATVNGVQSNTDSKTVNQASADLGILKTHTPEPVTAGQMITYTLVVTNAGPSAVTGATITDTLPVTLTSPTWTCTASAGSSCTSTSGSNNLNTSANMLVNGIVTYTITATVSSTATGTLVNTGYVAPPVGTLDPNPSNNSSTDTATVQLTADLGILKTHTPEPVTAGQMITYTLVVTNAGPSAVTGATITDTFPAILTSPAWTCVASIGSNCTSASGSGDLNTSANMLVNGIITYTITATVSSTATGTLVNTGYVAPPVGAIDPNPSNNNATDVATLITSADLAIGKTHSGNLIVGQTGTYTITVTNNGPSTAAPTINVTDTLPTGLSYSSGTGTNWSCAAIGQTVTCTNPISLTASTATTLTLNVNVSSSAIPGITNTVTVSSPTTDPVPGNNTTTDPTTVTTRADLALAKTHSGNFSVGVNGTYTLTVTNNGPSTAVGPIVVTDTLPAGLTYVSGSGSGWACSAVGQNATCTRATDLTSGSTSSFNLTVAVSSGAIPGVTNVAGVSSTTSDPDPSNNLASDPTTVGTIADLVLTKTHSGSFTVGTNGTYTLTVTNNGPSTALGNIVVTDTLPTGLTFLSGSGIGWTCSAVGQTVTCNHTNDMALSESATFTLSVGVAISAAPSVTNTATVSSPTSDPAPSNNTATDPTTVLVPADLAISKTDGLISIAPGQPLTYTIVVTNLGPYAVTGATVTDALPTTLTGATWTCAASIGSSCNAGSGSGNINTTVNLAVNGIITLTVPTTVSLSANTSITNTATVAAPSGVIDPNLGNNSSTDTTSVIATPPDLSIVKGDGGISVTPGGTITYTLSYSNTGNIGATNVTITETVPTNTTFTGSGWSCSPNNNAGSPCTRNMGTVAGGGGAGSASFVVTVNSTLPAGTIQISNTASIGDDATNGTDPTPGNNQSSDTTPVTGLAHDVMITKSDGGITATANSLITYTLRYTNTGNIGVSNVLLSETVPANTTFAGPPATWSCSISDPAGTPCLRNVGVMGIGSGSVSFVVRVNASLPITTTMITNTVSISDDGANGADSNLSNNTAQDPTPITGLAAALALSKTANVSTVNPGSVITYTLRYTNTGNADATGVVITETVPANTTFTGAGWTCSPNNNAGSACTRAVGTLAGAGGSGSAQFVVMAASSLSATQIANTVAIADDRAHTAITTITTPARPSIFYFFLPLILRLPTPAPTPTPTTTPTATNTPTPSKTPSPTPIRPIVDPKGMVSDAGRDRLYLVNNGDSSVTVFRESTITSNPTMLAKISVGTSPFGIGMVDDKVYVANSGGMGPSSVSVISAATMTKVRDIPLSS
ncbi:MAG: DUF11 domain-containing protein, partial [Chloroflexota bacterium]|nr:DUF11 domain-containing protein [Chloroflexota bacterium]